MKLVKKILTYLPALIFLFSCQNSELDVSLHQENLTGIQKELREVTITADIGEEAKTVDPATRTTLIFENGVPKTYWTPGDTIKIFSAGQSAKFTSINTEPSRKAKFVGLVSMIIGDDGESEKDYVWGLYPYRSDATYAEPDGEGHSSTAVITTTLPSGQIGMPGTFSSGLATMIGRSETLTISYKNAYSGVYIRFNRSDIVSVTLKGRHGENLAGRFTVGLDSSMNPEVKQVVSGQSQVTITDPVNGTFVPGQNYFLVTLPDVALQEGYSLTVRRSDGYEATFNSLTTVKSLDRNIFKTFNNPLDTYIENASNISNGRSTGWVLSTSTPVNEIWYKSVDNVEIPYAEGQDATVNQLVANIPPSADNDNWGIMRFAAPVTETDYRGFNGAQSLLSVKLPVTLETINTESFVGCNRLETIELGPNLKTIKGRAFMSCRGLKNIHIPESVTSIGSLDDKDYLMNPFLSCLSLESFSGKFASSDGRSLIVDDLLLSFATSGMRDATYIVPSSVRHIGQYAFYQADFSGISLPEGLITIQDFAFAYNSRLKSVAIPSTLEALYYGAFQRCLSLDWVEIKRADHVMELRQSESHVNSSGYSVFFGTNDCPIYVPSNLLDQYKTATDWNAYADRYKSKQPDYAIWYTTTDGAAASYTLPEAYQSYASSIQNIAPNDNNNAPGIGWLKFPINLTEIPERLFKDCANLKTVMIPDGVRYIQSNAFMGCANLEDVKFGGKVEVIDTWAFEDCNLSSVYLPNSLTYLGQACFRNNPLSTIHIPESVTTIGLNPFSDCENLASFTGDNPMVADAGRCIIDSNGMLISFAPASVTGSYSIPNGVRIIEDGAIRKAQFQTVTIPLSVERIGGWNFINCPNLTTVTIFGGENLEIGTCVIRSCPLLTRINMDSAIPPSIEEDTFFYIPSSGSPELGIPESCLIAIPGSGRKNYESANSYPQWYALRDHFFFYQATNEIWYHYKDNQVSATLNITADFGANGLNQSVLLKDLSKISPFVPIPNSIVPAASPVAIVVAAFDGKVTKIPEEVFSSSRFGGEMTLDWVSLPNSVNTIGNRAFKGASSLKYFPVVSSYSLTSIGDDAFRGCSVMSPSSAAIFLSTISSIGDRAFQECSGINRIVMKATSIGKSAFKGCSGLKIAQINGTITEIADSTFASCSNLEAVLLPNPGSITTVGEYAFYQDRKLKTVGPDNGVAEVYLPGVTELKKGAFFNCSELERVRMPELLTIGENVFNSNGYLSAPVSFSLPKLRTIQGWYSFGHLIADELYLPSLKDAGSASFIFGYSQIKNLRFGPSLESLPYLNNTNGYCFNDSTSSMERNLYFEGSTPPRFGPRTFVTDYNYSGPSSVLLNLNSIHVPAGCKEAYKTALHNANSLYDGFFSIIVDDL